MNNESRFQYSPGKTKFHGLHGGTKILWLILLSFGIFRTNAVGVFIAFAIILPLTVLAGISFRRILTDMLAFWFLGLLIFFSTLYNSPVFSGDLFFFLRDPSVLLGPAVAVSRYLFVIMLTNLLVQTTSMLELRHSIAVFCKKCTILKLVSFLISLMVNFIPLIFQETRKLQDSMKVKMLNPRRHPVRYISILATGLLRNSIRKSSSISEALIVRRFQIDYPVLAKPLDSLDISIAIASILLTLILTILF